MANIPVERTGGTPWWLWLLGLLLLIGLIWFLAELFTDDDDEVAVVDDVTAVDPVDFDCPAIGADVVTSPDQLMNVGGADLMGCQVDLQNVRVLSLTGDSSFVVGTSPDPERGILVVLRNMNESESLPAPPTGRDGDYNIDVGETLSIDGEIMSFSGTAPDYAEMDTADRDRILRSGLYVAARSVSGPGVTTQD